MTSRYDGYWFSQYFNYYKDDDDDEVSIKIESLSNNSDFFRIDQVNGEISFWTYAESNGRPVIPGTYDFLITLSDYASSTTHNYQLVILAPDNKPPAFRWSLENQLVVRHSTSESWSYTLPETEDPNDDEVYINV